MQECAFRKHKRHRRPTRPLQTLRPLFIPRKSRRRPYVVNIDRPTDLFIRETEPPRTAFLHCRSEAVKSRTVRSCRFVFELTYHRLWNGSFGRRVKNLRSRIIRILNRARRDHRREKQDHKPLKTKRVKCKLVRSRIISCGTFILRCRLNPSTTVSANFGIVFICGVWSHYA